MRASALVYAVTALSIASPAMANIDLTTGSTNIIVPFGAPDTSTYGQTFFAGAGNTSIESFSLFLQDRVNGSGPLNLRGYIGSWENAKVTDILYSSSTVTMNAAGTLQQFLFTPATPIPVTPGSQYVAFLSISDLPEQLESTFGMPFVDDTISGNFVYFNNGLNFAVLTQNTWNQFTENDVYITVNFGSGGAVPEPESWALLIAGFGLTGAAMRRRRSTVAA